MDAERLEADLGASIRALRVHRRLTREQLAARANVSSKALQRLENGRGSTITTLVRAVAALDANDWLTALTPAPEFDPFEVLEQARREERQATRARRSRVRHSARQP